MLPNIAGAPAQPKKGGSQRATFDSERGSGGEGKALRSYLAVMARNTSYTMLSVFFILQMKFGLCAGLQLGISTFLKHMECTIPFIASYNQL